MENLVIELSKYIIIILMAIYTLYCYTVFRNNNKKRQEKIFKKQRILILAIHTICHLILLLDTKNIKIIGMYALEILFFFLVVFIYQFVYKNLSKLVLNNMLFCLMFSFTVLTRLIYGEAIRQFVIAAAALLVCLIVPFVIERFTMLEKLGWLYGIFGIFLLGSVFLIGIKKHGAVNWIELFGVHIQPSEFVKISFVFFLAALLAQKKDIITVLKVSILSGIHVLILVIEKDLGGALIYFITYVILVYVATAKPVYFFGGLAGGSFAACIAYQLFSHVKVRVIAWKDPFSHYEKEGYQVAQSLFAIGTGGWFGMGFCKGLPSSIPIKSSDFIFSAISEEFGGIFSLCLILIYISCFIMFVNIAMKMKTEFYKLAALGLATIYIFQVFLNIGGVIKFIPSTGVTLPLISYGGSSLISTIMVFSIIQGLYVLNQDRNHPDTKKEKGNGKYEKRKIRTNMAR